MTRSLRYPIAVATLLGGFSSVRANQAPWSEDVRKLPELTTFTGRALAYGRLYHHVQEGPVDCGILGAASDVTAMFAAGMTYEDVEPFLTPFVKVRVKFFSETTQTFMPTLSQELAKFNAPMIQKLLSSGSPDGVHKTGPEIDDFWVEAEQTRAEQLLRQLPVDDYKIVCSDMDANLLATAHGADLASLIFGTELPSPVRAANLARVMLRETEKREPRYGNLQDRIFIGKITAMLNRRSDRLIPVTTMKEELFEVEVGDIVTISAQGKIGLGPTKVFCGPEGLIDRSYIPFVDPPLLSAPYGALLFDIKSFGKTTPYLVGKSLRFRVKQAGMLRVYVNDALTNDNKGMFLVSAVKAK